MNTIIKKDIFIGFKYSDLVKLINLTKSEQINFLENLLISKIENLNQEEKESNLQRKLLIFENQLLSLTDIENNEKIIKSMEEKLLDNTFYEIFENKIYNYFNENQYKEGVIIFLSNIFEPSIRKKIYLFFWHAMHNNKLFKTKHGNDFIKIIQSIIFNEKDLNDFEYYLENE